MASEKAITGYRTNLLCLILVGQFFFLAVLAAYVSLVLELEKKLKLKLFKDEDGGAWRPLTATLLEILVRRPRSCSPPRWPLPEDKLPASTTDRQMSLSDVTVRCHCQMSLSVTVCVSPAKVFGPFVVSSRSWSRR